MWWYPFAAFGGQFMLVFFLGLNVRFVSARNFRFAFLTSLCISASELTVVVTLVKNITNDHGNILVYTAFMLGGAFGIVSSMKAADLVERWLRR